MKTIINVINKITKEVTARVASDKPVKDFHVQNLVKVGQQFTNNTKSFKGHSMQLSHHIDGTTGDRGSLHFFNTYLGGQVSTKYSLDDHKTNVQFYTNSRCPKWLQEKINLLGFIVTAETPIDDWDQFYLGIYDTIPNFRADINIQSGISVVSEYEYDGLVWEGHWENIQTLKKINHEWRKVRERLKSIETLSLKEFTVCEDKRSLIIKNLIL